MDLASTSTSYERALSRLVERHTDPKRGMTNGMVNALCSSGSMALASQSGRSPIFAGVFCADTIPPFLADQQGNETCFVVNLAKSPSGPRRRRAGDAVVPSWPLTAQEIRLLGQAKKSVGVGWKDVDNEKAKTSLPADSGHFVFIHFKPKLVFYADSFGLPCYQEDVRREMARACVARQVGLTFVEDTIQHPLSMTCGLFAALRVLAAQADVDQGFFLWNKTDLKLNDELCIQYIRLLLR